MTGRGGRPGGLNGPQLMAEVFRNLHEENLCHLKPTRFGWPVVIKFNFYNLRLSRFAQLEVSVRAAARPSFQKMLPRPFKTMAQAGP